MKVLKVFVDFDKEEDYLNMMSQKGHGLVKYSSLGIYTFKKIEPQSLHYKVDYRVFMKKSQFKEYVTLFEDSGWEHVYGTPYSGSQYFLPKSQAMQDEHIFSDMESKAGRCKRLYARCLASFSVLIAYLVITMPGTPNRASYLDFDSWYFTPNLWEKTGAEFWRAFIFETPFVVLRVLPIFVLMLLTIIYGVWSFKAYKIYKRTKSESNLQNS